MARCADESLLLGKAESAVTLDTGDSSIADRGLVMSSCCFLVPDGPGLLDGMGSAAPRCLGQRRVPGGLWFRGAALRRSELGGRTVARRVGSQLVLSALPWGCSGCSAGGGEGGGSGQAQGGQSEQGREGHAHEHRDGGVLAAEAGQGGAATALRRLWAVPRMAEPVPAASGTRSRASAAALMLTMLMPANAA